MDKKVHGLVRGQPLFLIALFFLWEEIADDPYYHFFHQIESGMIIRWSVFASKYEFPLMVHKMKAWSLCVSVTHLELK